MANNPQPMRNGPFEPSSTTMRVTATGMSQTHQLPARGRACSITVLSSVPVHLEFGGADVVADPAGREASKPYLPMTEQVVFLSYAKAYVAVISSSLTEAGVVHFCFGEPH